MKAKILIMLLFASCSEAGVLPDDASSSTSADPVQITGVVGLGSPLVNAAIAVVNVTDAASPVVVLSTTSDGTGYFSMALDDVASSDKLLLTASGGSYIDPLTFETVVNENLSLKGVWKKSSLSTFTTVHVTPLSTLEASFYNCLVASQTLAADPLDYAVATFNTVFGINLNTVEDTYLSQAESNSEADTLYSLYNLGFARMAKETRATAALDLVTRFADELEVDCDFLGPVGDISGQYAFHSESFRRDYLNALLNLPLEASLTDLTDDVDLESVVEGVRQSTNILFEFGAYDL